MVYTQQRHSRGPLPGTLLSGPGPVTFPWWYFYCCWAQQQVARCSHPPPPVLTTLSSSFPKGTRHSAERGGYHPPRDGDNEGGKNLSSWPAYPSKASLQHLSGLAHGAGTWGGGGQCLVGLIFLFSVSPRLIPNSSWHAKFRMWVFYTQL